MIIPIEELSPIAHPLAQKKLLKKLHKTIKKGVSIPLTELTSSYTMHVASKKRQVKRGVKEVVKGIRKGDKGFVVFLAGRTPTTYPHCNRLLVLAADISPIDIISHLPVLSEDASIPYIFVTSKEELGHASSTKRPTSCVMICPSMKRKPRVVEGQEEDKEDDYRELYDECLQEVQALDEKILI